MLPLTAEQRSVTVNNMMVNMRGMCFFSGKDVSEADALTMVMRMEEVAFAEAGSIREYTRSAPITVRGPRGPLGFLILL